MVDINLGEATVDIRASLAKLNQDLSQAKRTVSRSMKDIGDTIDKAGQTLLRRVTLPVTGAFTGAALATANFETAISRAGAIANATTTQFRNLADQAKELGSTTEFSASQAAEAMRFLAQAGFEVNDILSATPGILDLAVVAQTDLATAADLASNILTQFRMEASRINVVNDQLATAATSSNVSVLQLADSLKFAGPAAAALEIPLNEVIGALGKLGDAGLQGSSAGTSLNNAFLRLISNSDKVQEALDDLGVQAFDTSGELRSLPDILEDIEESNVRTGRTAAQTGALLQEAFGIRGVRAIANLVGKSQELREFNQVILETQGTAERLAQQFRGPLERAFVEFRSAVEGASIAIGEAGLSDFLQDVLGVATDVARGIRNLDSDTLNLGITITGIAAAAGPLAILIGGMTRLLGILLSFSNPISATVTALTLLGTAFGIITARASRTASEVDQVQDNLDRTADALADASTKIRESAQRTATLEERLRALEASEQAVREATGLGTEARSARIETLQREQEEVRRLIDDEEDLRESQVRAAEAAVLSQQLEVQQRQARIAAIRTTSSETINEINQLRELQQAMIAQQREGAQLSEQQDELARKFGAFPGPLVTARLEELRSRERDLKEELVDVLRAQSAAQAGLEQLVQARDELAASIVRGTDARREDTDAIIENTNATVELSDADQELIDRTKDLFLNLERARFESRFEGIGEAMDRARASTKALNDELERQAKRVIKSIRTPTEKFNDELEELGDLLERGLLTQDQFGKAVQQARDQLQDATDDARSFGEILEGAAEEAGRSIQRNIADTLNNLFTGRTGSIGDFFRDLANTASRVLSDILAESLVNNLGNIFRGAGGGGGDGGFLSGIFGFFKDILPFQRGGILRGPTAFPLSSGLGIAGERNAEGILPLASVNGMLGVLAAGAGGPDVNVQIINNTPAPTRVERNSQGGRDMRVIIGEMMGDDVRSGGPLGQAISQSFQTRRRTTGR